EVRYRIWFAASLKFLVPFSALTILGAPLAWMRVPVPAPASSAAPVVSFVIEPFTETPSAASLASSPARSTPLIWVPAAVVGIWACGFLAIAAIRLRQWRRVRAAVAASAPFEPVESADPAIPRSDDPAILRPCDPATPRSCDVAIRSAPGLLEPGVVGF